MDAAEKAEKLLEAAESRMEAAESRVEAAEKQLTSEGSDKKIRFTGKQTCDIIKPNKRET